MGCKCGSKRPFKVVPTKELVTFSVQHKYKRLLICFGLCEGFVIFHFFFLRRATIYSISLHFVVGVLFAFAFVTSVFCLLFQSISLILMFLYL